MTANVARPAGRMSSAMRRPRRDVGPSRIYRPFPGPRQRGRSDRDSSPCSTQRRSHAQTSLWHRLRGRPVSESGRFRHGDGTRGWGAHRRRVLELPTLAIPPSDRASRGDRPPPTPGPLPARPQQALPAHRPEAGGSRAFHHRDDQVPRDGHAVLARAGGRGPGNLGGHYGTRSSNRPLTLQ